MNIAEIIAQLRTMKGQLAHDVADLLERQELLITQVRNVITLVQDVEITPTAAVNTITALITAEEAAKQ